MKKYLCNCRLIVEECFDEDVRLRVLFKFGNKIKCYELMRLIEM